MMYKKFTWFYYCIIKPILKVRVIVMVSEREDEKPGVLDFALNAIIAVAQLIAQSSYIGTNIIMMVSYLLLCL